MPHQDTYIIQQRFPDDESATFSVDQDILAKHGLAIFLATNLHSAFFEKLLKDKTDKALKSIKAISDARLNALIQNHTTHFPNRYKITSDVATLLLYKITLKLDALVADKTKPSMIVENLSANATQIIINLLETGANPFFVLSDHGVTPHLMEAYLRRSPRNAEKGFSGRTLHHSHMFRPNYIAAILPVLNKYYIDVNTPNPQAGTVCHIILANERVQKSIEFLEATQPRLEPSITDCEGKTIPIIAAKVRNEKFLLRLADMYPPEKLALNAQDENGCGLLHYCHALGLIEATTRYVDLGADINIVDNKGHSPRDYLNLSPEETSAILRSIEIHADRDSSVEHNAIVGEPERRPPVLVNGQPQLAINANFNEGLMVAAEQQFGKTGKSLVEQQQKAMTGISLLEAIMANRRQIEHNYANGVLIPEDIKGSTVSGQAARCG